MINLENASGDKKLIMSPGLVSSLNIALWVDYECSQKLRKEKGFSGTENPTITSSFKNRTFLIDGEEVKIGKVKLVSGGGVGLFIKGTDETIYIAEDELEIAIRKWNKANKGMLW